MDILILFAPIVVVPLVLRLMGTQLRPLTVVVAIFLGWPVSMAAGFVVERLFGAPLGFCQVVFGLIAPATFGLVMVLSDRLVAQNPGTYGKWDPYGPLLGAVISALIQAVATLLVGMMSRR